MPLHDISATTGGSDANGVYYFNELGSSVTILATNLTAVGTTIWDTGQIYYDGAMVKLEVWCADLDMPSNAVASNFHIQLCEGASLISAFVQAFTQNTTVARGGVPVYGVYHFTPTAGPHEYLICGVVSSTTGTPKVRSNDGGPPVFAKAWARISKA